MRLGGLTNLLTRFDQFQERLGISRNILSERLGRLVEAGIFDKVSYCERPLRHEYRLTERGRDLWPVITTMRQWGDKHAAPEGPPVQVVHKDCGEVSEAVLVCSECREPVAARDVRALAGPGARVQSPL